MIAEVIPRPGINKNRGYTRKKESHIPTKESSFGYVRYKYGPIPMENKIYTLKYRILDLNS